MCSTADPRSIAGKIAAEVNRGECRVCHRPIDGGVYAFGTSGSDGRWYENLDAARTANRDRARILFPLPAEKVTPDDVLEWLEAQRDELDAMIEHVHNMKAERRAARELREQSSGFRTGQWPCADCGFAKDRPSDECERCGDNPVPLGITAEDFNRARGYTH